MKQQFNKFSKNIEIKNRNKFSFIDNNKINLFSNLNSSPKKRINLRNNRNNDNASKEEMKSNTKNDNTLITTFNNDPNYEISYNDKTFEEIYDDIDEDIIRNNYISNKKQNFMKNNYLEYRRKEMFLKIKKALNPINNQNFLDDYNPYRKKKKKSFVSETGNVIKDRLKNFLYDFDCNIKINRFNTYPKYYNWNDKNSKNDSRKNSKFSKFFDEESGFMGNERFFQPSNFSKNNNNSKSKNDSDSDLSEENKNSDILTVNKRRKISDDLISEKKSERSEKTEKTEKSEKIEKSEKSDNNSSYIGRRNKKRKNDNEIITLKTENSDLYKERIKSNIGKSLNKENRNLKTSLMDINSSRLKLNRKNIGKGKNDQNDSNIEDKILLSTQSEIDIIDPITKESNFCKFYFKYFMKREIFLASFYDKYDKVASFIRIPTFLFVITFIFAINCLLLTANYIHNRYIYAQKNNGINEAKYVISNELGKSFLCAIISNILKMIIIKLIYWKIFKISYKLKKGLIPTNNMSEEETKYILFKKEEYFKSYKKKAFIYIIIILSFIIIFAYISINYIGTFPNTRVGILFGFILSVVLSFLLCLLICFIIVSLHFLGQKCEVECLNYLYKFSKIIY